MADQTTVIEGKVEIDPYGTWSDVDKGVYVGGETVVSTDEILPPWTILSEHEGRRVRLTIELLPDETDDDD